MIISVISVKSLRFSPFSVTGRPPAACIVPAFPFVPRALVLEPQHYRVVRQPRLSDQLGQPVVWPRVPADISVVALHRRYLLVVEARAVAPEGLVPRVGTVVAHNVEECVVLFVDVELGKCFCVVGEYKLAGREGGV